MATTHAVSHRLAAVATYTSKQGSHRRQTVDAKANVSTAWQRWLRMLLAAKFVQQPSSDVRLGNWLEGSDSSATKEEHVQVRHLFQGTTVTDRSSGSC